MAYEVEQTPARNYGDCPRCRAGHLATKAPGRQWSSELAPWFQAMKRSEMDPDLTQEYERWFGHIMFGWWMR